jgi:hypothetical protein
MREAEVFDRFAADGVITEYGELYLPKSRALDLIAVCQENDLAIIGIEGFIYDAGKFVPQSDLIADYSTSRASRERDWIEYRDSCNTAAKHFVQSANSRENLYFTFVISSCEEFAK